MNKRKTIGNELIEQLDDNPFDLLSTHKEPINGKEKATQKTTNAENIPQEIKKKKPQKEINVQIDEQNALHHIKERMTVQINKSTRERVKDCVYWNRITVAHFVEEALENALEKSERENGAPFQKRRSELKPGRPTK